MELIEGDRIIYEGSQYFITYIIKNSGSTIYRARDTMNHEIRLSETEIQNVEIDEKYGIIIRRMHEIMDQHVMTDNYNYIYRYGKYSLQGTTQGRYLTGGVPPVRFSM